MMKNSIAGKLKTIVKILLSLGFILLGLIAAGITIVLFGFFGYMVQALTTGVTGSWTDPGFVIGAFLGVSFIYGLSKIFEDLDEVSRVK